MYHGLDARINEDDKERNLDVPDSWSVRTSLGNLFRDLEVRRDDITGMT